MSIEHERLTVPMDLELKWAKEKLLERDKQISGLISKNISLREELQENISLRDHFAGLAMQSLLTKASITVGSDSVAMAAYHVAHQMLKERSRGEKKDV